MIFIILYCNKSDFFQTSSNLFHTFDKYTTIDLENGDFVYLRLSGEKNTRIRRPRHAYFIVFMYIYIYICYVYVNSVRIPICNLSRMLDLLVIGIDSVFASGT